MKNFFIKMMLIGLVLGVSGCGKGRAEMSVTEEVSSEEQDFVLGENLEGAIVQLAMKVDSFDESLTKEVWYPESVFLRGFCQNSQYTFEYLEEQRETNGRMLSREQVEYIHYSLTGVKLDMS